MAVNATPSQDAARTLAEVPLSRRAAQIRYDINWQGTAVRMQYERLVAHMGLSPEERVSALLHAVVDLDFLVISVHRLLHVAKRARAFGCGTDAELKTAINLFSSRWLPQLRDVRNALEHLDHGSIGIVPVQGGGTISFIWRDGQLDVHELFKAADKLIKTICLAIQPLES